jgi:uncharacterized protein with beta-barrel porin domain
MASVWACPGSIAAAGRPVGLRFRDVFLGTVAAGALSLALGSPALAVLPAGCTISGGGTIETCTGDQHNGVVAAGPPVTTLNVNSLTTAIAPASGTDGIKFTSGGAVTISSDTGAFGITTAGAAADGIFARSTGSGPVTVTSTGNITTAGSSATGIVAYGNGGGAVTVTSTGNITTTGSSFAFGILTLDLAGGTTVTSTGNITTAGSNSTGISARATGAVTATSTGNITTAGNAAYGILAQSGTGSVTVTSTGNITTAGAGAFGIDAGSFGAGAIAVTSTGNIATTGNHAHGIYSYSTAGAITVSSTGNISTAGTGSIGIRAQSGGAGAVTVTSNGNITSASSHAISAESDRGGAVTVTSTGNITAGAFGILAEVVLGAGAVTVSSAGNIATGASGINAFSIFGAGAVTVTSTGNITTTTGFGIFAGNSSRSYLTVGAVTVTSTGNITTAGNGGIGIEAASNIGAVKVTSAGNITTAGTSAKGIYAISSASTGGTVTVTVSSTGNITTAGTSANGIKAYIGGIFGGTGAVTVSSTGNITTAGNNATGIFAQSPGAVTVTSTGNIATAGTGAQGIFAVGSGTGAVTVTSIGNIAVAGANAFGIVAENLAAGAVTVTSSGNITASGSSNSNGIAAASGGGPITVTVNSGTVSGGSGISAGVVIAGGTNNTLTNFGTLTALSGNAIVGEVFGTARGNNTVNNFGTVTGSVILDSTTAVGNMILGGGGGAHTFNNMVGGVFNPGTTVSLGAGNTLTNAGTLSPGGAGVTQTTALSGNLVQSATGIFLTDINIAGATSDRVNVSGKSNLAGAVQLQVQNVTFAPWQQTVLSAAGGTTTNGLMLLASPVLQAQLVYPNSTDVVVKSTGLNFVVPGLNNNQTSLANALNSAGHTYGLGGPVFNLLLNGVTSAAGYNVVLNKLTGEGATGTQQTTFDAMKMFMGTMTDPFTRGTTPVPGGGASGYASEGDASAYASDGRQRTGAERDAYAMFTKTPLAQSYDPRWSVWASGFGGSQTTDGNATVGSNNTTSSVYGTAVGADYIFSPRTIAGFALAGGGTNFSVAGSGSGHSDLFQAGAFIRHTVGPAYISAALAYGWQDITTNRTVTVAGTDQLRAQFNANAFSGRLEGGYRFVAPWVGGIGITPYAAAQFTTFDLPGYAEQAIVGTNNFALAYGAKDVTDTRSELGLRADKSWAMKDGILTLRGRVAWAHDYDPNRSIASTFQSLPGASFVVNGAAQAADSALVTASIEKKWLSGWSAAATFEGEFSDVTRSYAGKGVVRYAW